MAMLAPFLDGNHTYQQIVDALEGKAGPLDIRFGLSQLEERGYISEADDSESHGLATLRDILGIGASAFKSALDSMPVTVRTCRGTEPGPFVKILQSLGIRTGGSGGLTVVLVDHHLQAELEEFHQDAIRTGLPWMIVKPLGSVPAFGPIFRPGPFACFHCLALRLRESPETQALLPLPKEDRYSRLDLPAVRDAALNLVAIEILKWIVQSGAREIDRMLFTLDAAAMNLHRHLVVQRENCPSCGVRAADSSGLPAPVALRSRVKRFTTDGGHRPQDPETVYERLRYHVSALTGVVHTLDRIDGADSQFVHVYRAGHNFSLDPNGAITPEQLTASSRGKGMSALQARASALCEALERYSGVFRGNEIRQHAQFGTLGDAAIHPNACLNFSQAQYEHRRPWKGDPRDWVPEPFDESKEVDWSPVWSLTERRFKYLPTACCYYGYPQCAGHEFARADSNGCAAGSTLEDAILQGFLEVVERDSMAIWWMNRLRRPAFDLSTFPEPRFGAMQDYYTSLGRRVWVLDITADFGIPAAVAVSIVQGERQPDLLLGAGAHFDPMLAVARALTELNQALPSALSRRSRVSDKPSPVEAFLYPDVSARRKLHGDFPVLASPDLLDDVEACVGLARKNGLEVLVLDQTRIDVGLPVVRVIVPGMRHFWPRKGPGRLYEVPVKMGWLTDPTPERDLNPAVIGM
jgi:oxazoline/thiazoline synthase